MCVYIYISIYICVCVCVCIKGLLSTTSPNSRAECHEIWEPKPPGTLWATSGLLWDSFTYCRHVSIQVYRLQGEQNASFKTNCPRYAVICKVPVQVFKDHRPTTHWVHHTTSCIAQSNAPDDGQNCCLKHVELIWVY
jgi:hypothetical protein